MPSRQELDAVVSAANSNIPGALDKLRELLDACPQIWEQVGDMRRQAEVAVVTLIARGDKLVQESLFRQIKQMREELCDQKCSAMEKLLIGRVVLAWLHVMHLSTTYQIQPDGQSIAVGKYLMHVRESAQRQLNAALSALATYRKVAPAKFTIQRPTLPFPGADSEEGK